MTRGAVRKLSAWVPVTLVLPHGGEREIECLIDTGFSGHLSLPAALAESLQLIPGLTGDAELADATEIQVQLYEGMIQWQGYEVEVDILATGNRPLLGTGLLAGWELRAQFIEGGQVVVREIEADGTPAETAKVTARTQDGPTHQQGQFLAFIREYTERNYSGVAPRHVDFQKFFNLTAPSVNSMLIRLEQRGFIRRIPGKARAIELVIDPRLIPPLDRPFKF